MAGRDRRDIILLFTETPKLNEITIPAIGDSISLQLLPKIWAIFKFSQL
jgi:hypothetical protein